jgi:hypothetical protein
LNGLSLGVSSITASVFYTGFPISEQNIQVTPSVNLITPLIYNIPHSNRQYTAYQYSGILTISNIVLNTTPGFVYDIYLQCNMNFVDPKVSTLQNAYYEYFNTVTSGIFCNLSAPNIKNTVNTVITSSPPISLYSSYKLIGI